MASNIEKDFYLLTISISKALNGTEAPLKSKHARSIIIIIHKSKEAKTFWTVLTRQAIMENRFTAWKFCHLVHKVLREAHECALKHSQRHKKMILELGKLWGHLQNDIGSCIKAYSKLLVTKLNFHEKNRMYPGNLVTTINEINSVANDDFNYYFQLCVEIFDYLEDIIALQVSILSSINTYRISSMTQQGQCRLAPLITLVQDSNPLYDMSVRIMFKLHEKLPDDVLVGHRERFCIIFANLKLFYDNIRPLQYFHDLITVPNLPDLSPNFKSQVDFGSYIPPVVFVQTEPDILVDDLIDTTVSENEFCKNNDLLGRINMLESEIEEKKKIIDQLTSKSIELNSYMELERSYKNNIIELQKTNSILCTELASTKQMYTEVRIQKDELELKLANNPTLIQKAFDEEEKHKLSSEKFNKLKLMYTEIRDEHINLLRQHGETSKLVNKEKQINAELSSMIKDLNSQIAELNENIMQIKDKNKKLLELTEDQKTENLQIDDAGKQMKLKYDTIVKEKDNEFLNLSLACETLKEENQKLKNVQQFLKETTARLDEAEKKITDKNEEISKTCIMYEEKLMKLTNENEETHKFQQKDLLFARALLKETETKLMKKDADFKKSHSVHNELIQENESLKKNIANMEEKLTLHDTNLVEAVKKAESLKILNDSSMKNMNKMLKQIIHTLKNICSSKVNNVSQQPIEAAHQISVKTEELLDNLSYPFEPHGSVCIEKIDDILNMGFCFINLYDQCDVIYSSTTEIDKGQEVLSIVQSILPDLKNLFDFIEENKHIDLASSNIKMKLLTLKKQLQLIANTFENTIDLDKLVQEELKQMDYAIEEAARKIIHLLSKTREDENKIKLKVNEKILEACTTLMECIKILNTRSRVLQNEIVSSQKGNATANDFYKRNSQWSDGLISASKSVAKAANYLVEAANNAINNDSGQNFEIIVAAQEIAACTVQLVIASKVKANRDSPNLANLTIASRNVTKATGNVVASVKDGNSRVEEHYDNNLCTLTPSQLKTTEMEIHVKVLELEHSLETERLKLSAFRKEHYQKTEY